MFQRKSPIVYSSLSLHTLETDSGANTVFSFPSFSSTSSNFNGLHPAPEDLLLGLVISTPEKRLFLSASLFDGESNVFAILLSFFPFFWTRKHSQAFLSNYLSHSDLVLAKLALKHQTHLHHAHLFRQKTHPVLIYSSAL